MERKWDVPVVHPYWITSSAVEHLRRSILCGIDFVTASTSLSLIAMSDGVVEYVHSSYNPQNAYDLNSFDSLGRFVVIKHYAGAIPFWVRMCHNDSVDVVAGQTVASGQVIGKYGWTGCVSPNSSDGAHVHLDSWVEASRVTEAQSIGFSPCQIQASGRWPAGDAVLVNVDPTQFFTSVGLDVQNSRG